MSDFPIIDEILDIVCEDCKFMEESENRKDFLKSYENLFKEKKEKLLKVVFGKKYAKTFNYDYDASLISSYIFCKTINIQEPEEWHIDCYRGYEYKIRKGNGYTHMKKILKQMKQLRTG